MILKIVWRVENYINFVLNIFCVTPVFMKISWKAVSGDSFCIHGVDVIPVKQKYPLLKYTRLITLSIFVFKYYAFDAE